MNHISQLLLKKLTGRLTPEEQATLDAWTGESDANRELYERLTNPQKVKQSLEVWEMADGSRACETMQRKVDSILLPRRVMKYAAAVVGVMVVIGSLFMLRNDDLSIDDANLQFAEVVAEAPTSIDQIRPGDTRALLFDESGRSVILGKNDSTSAKTDLISKIFHKKVQDLCLDVPRGSEFKVVLEDGTEVWLNSDSRLYYPQQFSGSDRRVKVEGEAYFAVATDSLRPFYVETGSQVIRVYGTSFNVRSYPDEGEVYTTLESGRVSLTRSDRQGGELYLTPGHQAVFNLADSKVVVREVNTEVVTSWKNGRFVFENQSLLRIMQDLSRWYDFEYEFADKSLENEVFMGSIPRYSDFVTAIGILDKCGGIGFELTDGKIIISRTLQ